MTKADLAEIAIWCLAATVAGVSFHTWYTPAPISAPSEKLRLRPSVSTQRTLIATPEYAVTAELAAYEDELFAYLMFQYLRRHPPVANAALRLTFDPQQPAAPYRILLQGENDLRGAIGWAMRLGLPWKLTPKVLLRSYEQQTRIFESAYNLPVQHKLEDLNEAALQRYLRRFIEFKSRTDPRIRMKREPIPQPLSPDQAQSLAGDILLVAAFYSLPLEVMVGVGAIENNYMNVRGDLEHSVWKRRPDPGDIVLERRRGRVRVSNFSSGVWQVTRETLRYAHKLVGRDTRDYSRLPEPLRPPEKLDIDQVTPRVLTTYAGMLLRDLLDRFDGDVLLAVGAYNGGPKNPNLRYGEGVRVAAEHARRVMEQAAALNGESVVHRSWLR